MSAFVLALAASIGAPTQPSPPTPDPKLAQLVRRLGDKSYRTRDPLRVTGEVTDWRGHSPAELKAMKDHLERLKRLGIEAIED